ncbi:extracellular solute-binding protein [Aeoliella mucimassa]|uniref:Iron uptake protein A1 n=1 Tax=Aeoliella mucimassa TaxID=2527972 RepID=A0A518AIC6_9BACT|nr:extracellular solute-binding protein [Aeoliella mucimassa]QDU54466.1 Iron uptake protein A1 precursor [Aeoliella mucimassa]
MAVARLAKGASYTLLAGAMLTAVAGCFKSEPAPVADTGQQVVVYTALDDIFSHPILDEYQATTGIEVLTKTDTESTKTIGLTEAIIAERERPRCDLFWNNEVMHTMRLAKLGILEPVEVDQAQFYPAVYRSKQGLWVGFAARARVLIVNTNVLAEARYPKSIKAIIDPLWRDRCGIAKPLAGSTATHAACLFDAWGDEEAKRFFTQVKANAQILSGNRDVAHRVAAGQLAFGLTDTDDAMVEIEAGSPVAIVYPDQRDGEVGTLFIPNTLAVIKGSAHPEQATELMNYLLQTDVEAKLVEGPSAQIPLHSGSKAEARVETPATVRAMEVDFEAAADKWDESAAAFLRDTFMAAQ